MRKEGSTVRVWLSPLPKGVLPSDRTPNDHDLRGYAAGGSNWPVNGLTTKDKG